MFGGCHGYRGGGHDDMCTGSETAKPLKSRPTINRTTSIPYLGLQIKCTPGLDTRSLINTASYSKAKLPPLQASH